MKSLVQFLLESENQIIMVNDLKATWEISDSKGNDVTIRVPQDYSDDDIQQYVNDLLLESMPSDDDLAKEYFGANADDIVDANIEYDEAKQTDDKDVTIDFDSSLDDKYKGNEDDFKSIKLVGLRLVVMFDKLDVMNTSEDTLSEDLLELFKRTESSDNVKYMNGKIMLKIEEKDLEFDETKNELLK